MHQKRELLQLHGQIDGDQADVCRQPQQGWCKVENALDAGGDQGVGDLLGVFRRHRDDGEFCLGGGDHLGQLSHAVHFQPFHLLPDLVRVGIEEPDELEALLGEAAIAQEGPRQVAGADDDRGPGAIDAETMAAYRTWQLPLPMAALCALVAGCAGGGLNALLIARLELPALIVTLGTFSLFRGIAEILSRNAAIFR